MNTYSIAYLNFNTGAREYIGSPMTSKQRAISTAKLHAKTAARGVCYEVHKETPGVVKHCVYQSGTGA